MSEITSAEFCERFAALVIGARELPRKPIALNVLLLSAVLGLEAGRRYSEQMVNEELQKWILMYGGGLGLDYVTLRRLLVDEGFLGRDPDGSSYRLEPTGPPFSYDPSIRHLDLGAVIATAKEERERRKREHAGSG
jgi:hypothetical protein